jgi:hypothetical protein
MDDIDVTAEREERFAPYLIASSKRPTGPEANGHCHYCDEPVGEGMRFCDAHCRDDWQKEQGR